MSDPSEPSLEPAESRAVELLRLVGSQTPAVSSRFTAELVERARRQRAVAVPMRAHRRPRGGDRRRARRRRPQRPRAGSTVIASVIERAGDQLGDFLPRIAGALLLLIIGLLAAIVLGRLTRRALVRVGLDRFADRSGTSELLGQAGLSSSLSALVGTAVRLTIVVVAVFASLTLLGLAFLSDSLNEGILYIPRLLVALALVLIGVVLGAFTRAWLERTSAQLDFPVAIGPVVQVLVIVLFGLCAAVQAGVTVAPLTAIAIILLAACAFTLALAFGLGAREMARSLTSGRYARADFEVGQTIRVGDVRGEIVSIEAAATTLKADNETIRVPNSLLVERTVVVEAAEPPTDVTPARPTSSGTAWTRYPTRRSTLFARLRAEGSPPIASRRSALPAARPQPRPSLLALRRADRGPRAGRLRRAPERDRPLRSRAWARGSAASRCRPSSVSSGSISAITPGRSARRAGCRR